MTLMTVVIGAVASWPSAADEPELVQRKSRQQATIHLARELIVDVLDVQLQQFADNGLDDLPVYDDVQTMRDEIDQLSRQPMSEMIELLTQAQRVSPREREPLVGQARRQARDVVAVLLEQREQVRKRMRVARLQQQLEQLIRQQRRVQGDTRELESRADDQRDFATLSVLEDQRDARQLFAQLIESLGMVRQWNGREGRAAKAGLQWLRDQGTPRLFEQVEKAVVAGELDRALTRQQIIIDHLQKALEKLEAVLGVPRRDPASTLQAIRELTQDQKSLRDETGNTDGSDQPALDRLSERQRGIHERMQEIDLSAFPAAQTDALIRGAQAASLKAEEDLFEGQRDAAITNQVDVEQQLKQLERLLEAMPSAASDESATGSREPWEQLEQLEQLSEHLGQLAEDQQQVLTDLAEAVDAAEPQQHVADALAREAERAPLPADVQDSVKQAADRGSDAARIMRGDSAATAADKLAAARRVEQAIAAARARTADGLQEARDGMRQMAGRTIARSFRSAQQESSSPAPRQLTDGTRAPADGQPRPNESDETNSQATASRRRAGEARHGGAGEPAVGPRSFAESPWFARLPEQLREAIRMRGRARAPSGYEDRLRRYFESVDN